jgi:hypothetical protein
MGREQGCMSRSTTSSNPRKPDANAGDNTVFMSILRSKSKPAQSSAMRVKAGVESVVYDGDTGTFEVLIGGRTLPADHPVVLAHPWAFEVDDSTLNSELVAGAVQSVSLAPPAPSDNGAAQRLAEIRAEIAALSEPVRPPRNDADLNELSQKLRERNERREALLLIVPSLERQVLAAAVVAAEGVALVETDAHDAAQEQFREAQTQFNRARSTADLAQRRVAATGLRAQRSQEHLASAAHALQAHDHRSNFADSDDPESDKPAIPTQKDEDQ